MSELAALSGQDQTEAGRRVSRQALYAPRGPDVLSRHALYWQEPPRGLLVGAFRQTMLPMARLIERIGEGIIVPEQIRAEALLDLYDETYQRTGLYWGDLIWWASPLNGFPWMEAIAGCPVEASRATGSVWANPHPATQEGLAPASLERILDGLEFDPANPWLRKLLECTCALVCHAAGRFPVSPGIMRGASDLVAALLGQAGYCLALYDHPEAVAMLAEACTRLWLAVIEAQFECIARFNGGYVNAGIWAPGPCPVYQEDASVMISKASFRRFFLTSGQAVWQRYPYAILHLHSAGLHIVSDLLEGAKPPVIEVNLDPSGPTVEQLLPTFAFIQEHTRLEVLGSQAQIRTCLAHLRPEGAAYLVLEDTIEE